MNPSTNLTVGPPPFRAREAEFVPHLTQAYNKVVALRGKSGYNINIEKEVKL